MEPLAVVRCCACSKRDRLQARLDGLLMDILVKKLADMGIQQQPATAAAADTGSGLS